MGKLLGDRIKGRREELGLMPVDIHRAIGVSISAVLQWESGSTKSIKLEHFFALADLLKVEARWLGIGEGPKDAQTKHKREPLVRGSVRKLTPPHQIRTRGQKAG